MPEQLTLEQEANRLCHRNDPDTSRDAAKEMIVSGRLNRQEQEVYNDIRRYIIDCNHTNFTAKELAVDYHNYFVIQRRLSGLYDKDKIEKTGERRAGCKVWGLKI